MHAWLLPSLKLQQVMNFSSVPVSASVYFFQHFNISWVLINREELADQSQAGGTNEPRGSMFVFCLTPWTWTSLLKSGNTQKSLRCHFTLTGAWTKVRGSISVAGSGWGETLIKQMCLLFWHLLTPFLEQEGFWETLGHYYTAVIQTTCLLTFTLFSKSLLAWHKHSALVAQIKTRSNILCFWGLVSARCATLKAEG